MSQVFSRPFCSVAGRPLLGAMLAAISLSAAVAASPPPAPSQPVTDLLQGISVADPYRNLEDLKNPQTQEWLKAQGAYATDQLGRIEGRAAMAMRVETLSKASGDSVRGLTRMPGERIYYLKRKVGENQLKLVLRVGLNGPERILVDPEKMTKATGVPHAINYFVPSWDGKTLAYGISAGGSEDASLHLLDIASGRAIGKPIPRVHEALVHWTPDSRFLSYNQVRKLAPGTPETETFLDTTVYLLKAGQAESLARPIFGPLVNKSLKLDRLDVGQVMFAPGSRYMLARTTDTTVPEGRLYVAPLAQLGSEAIAWRQISGFDDKITDVQLRGDQLFFRTYQGAPRGRVMSLPLKSGQLTDAVEVVPEPAVAVLQSFALGPQQIYAELKMGFNTRVHRYAAGLPAQGVDVAPKRLGSTFVIADPAHAQTDAWVLGTGWTEPPRLLATRGDDSSIDTGLLANQRPPGTPELEVTELLVPSHDGALVPLAILHRKGLVLDGSNPTLLTGYGAYGHSIGAYFDPRNIAWLERGGVLAYANVRGSGAFGDAWYRAGFKASKRNTWLDGLACARYLIEKRYSSPKSLGIWGTSAGGIFVGRAVTTAPELFAAAIFDVGVMDAVRAEESANGITNISEFGSARNPAELPALLEMSTYHQIKDDTAYPAVMLIHGMNDPRVDVWHSAKAAARLQSASSSGKPILMRLDGQAGHGVGSTAQQGFSKLADIYSFLLWQFGSFAQQP